MYTLVLVLSIIAAILLICVILVQKSKGGGLSSSFASSNQIMGVRRTNSFIEKLTWSLGAAIAVLAIISTFVMPNALQSTGTRVQAPATQQVEGGNYDTPAATEAAAPAATEAAAPAATEAAAPAATEAAAPAAPAAAAPAAPAAEAPAAPAAPAAK